MLHDAGEVNHSQFRGQVMASRVRKSGAKEVCSPRSSMIGAAIAMRWSTIHVFSGASSRRGTACAQDATPWSVVDDRHCFDLDPCGSRREGADLNERARGTDLIEDLGMSASNMFGVGHV